MVAKGLAQKNSPPAGPANHGGGEVVRWPKATVQSFEMLGNALVSPPIPGTMPARSLTGLPHSPYSGVSHKILFANNYKAHDEMMTNPQYVYCSFTAVPPKLTHQNQSPKKTCAHCGTLVVTDGLPRSAHQGVQTLVRPAVFHLTQYDRCELAPSGRSGKKLDPESIRIRICTVVLITPGACALTSIRKSCETRQKAFCARELK